MLVLPHEVAVLRHTRPRPRLDWADQADVPAVRYHHPGGTGNVARGRRGKRHEVPEPADLGRLGVLAERHHVVLGSHYQQYRRAIRSYS